MSWTPKLNKGIHTEKAAKKPNPLKVRLTGELRAKAYDMTKRWEEEHRQAQEDAYEVQSRRI